MCGGLVLIGLTAGAAPLEGVSLTWEAAAGCGSEAAVYERLAEALGPEWSSPTPVLARARLTPVGQIWHLEFSAVMEGAESRRELAVDSCDAAEVATALFTLLAVAPDFVEKLDTSLLNAREGRGSPGHPGLPTHRQARAARRAEAHAAAGSEDYVAFNPRGSRLHRAGRDGADRRHR